MTTGYDFADINNVATRTITYNADNMPTRIEYVKGGTVIAEYLYDGGGRRAKNDSSV